jgi:hypothetical protein
MKKLSARGKKYLCLVIFITALLSLSAYLLPPFLFNEHEYDFRREFFLAYSTLDTVDEIIQLRRAGPGQILSEAEYSQAGKDIEEGIQVALEHIGKAEELNEQQQSIPFLPGKFREYGKLKADSVQRYRANTEKFLQKKKNDHLLTNTMLLVNQSQEQISKMQDMEQWIAAIEAVPERTLLISRQAHELYDNKFITESLLNYFRSQEQAQMHIYDKAYEALETQSWDNFSWEGYGGFFEEDLDVAAVFQESLQISLGLTDEIEADREETYLLIQEASNYYEANKLAYDPLSKTVGLFNSDYPRMHFESTNRYMIPSGVNPNTVSVILQ